MSSRLLLLRHGATDWAAAGRWAGSTDVALTPHGEREAAAAAARLAAEPVARIWASPIGRAQHTARIVAAALGGAIAVEAAPDWREADFGPFEGLDPDRGDPSDPLIAAFRRHLAGEDQPGAEPLAVVAARAHAVVAAAAALPGLTLLVGHGTSTRLALCAALGLDPAAFRRFAIATAGVVELHGEPGRLRLHLG
jgi:probable phosphoglycerate mutase